MEASGIAYRTKLITHTPNSWECLHPETQKCSSYTYTGQRDTFPLKNASGWTVTCIMCTRKAAKQKSAKSNKENTDSNKPTKKPPVVEPDLSGISLQDCMELLEWSKGSSFELDTFIHLLDFFFEEKEVADDK